MNREKFIKVMRKFKADHEAVNAVDSILSERLGDSGIKDFFSAYSLICVNSSLVIELLKDCVGDVHDLIGYCLYEAGGREVFVKDAEDGSIICRIADAGSLFDAIEYLNVYPDVNFYVDFGSAFTELAI